MSVPAPKLPHLPLPVIRSIPTIPGVGKPGSEAALLVRAQFGNLPDLEAVIGIKALKKAINEQIYALIQGKLPDAVRPPVYDARAILLTDYVVEIVATLNAVIGGFVTELTAAISSNAAKLAELTAAKADVDAKPPEARTKLEALKSARLTEYIAEGNAQLARLNTSLSSIGA